MKIIKEEQSNNNYTNKIKKLFKEETGLEAIKVFKIGINTYIIEAEDGNTYKVG